jgi:hypothetical protein
MKIGLGNLQYIVHVNQIEIFFNCNDGNIIRKRYIGYKLREAKKLFLTEFKTILN